MEWVWQGHPGHLIVSRSCQFRLCTVVGKYLVSTVGECYLNDDDDKPTEIGFQRLYETMVFNVDPAKREACGCVAVEDYTEIDFAGANDAKEATENHTELCRKYEALQTQ